MSHDPQSPTDAADFEEDEGTIRTCEFCDKPGTTTEQDKLGNDCWVCEDHAQTLAAGKPERHSDEWYAAQKEKDSNQ